MNPAATQASPASDFIKRFCLAADSQALTPLLDQTRYLFHGVDIRDLPGIQESGFRWLSGKASFLLDAAHTIRKYATLGRNSRHCYGARYAQDLNDASSQLEIPGSRDAAEVVQAHWASTGNFTALLVFDRQHLLVRPGVGGMLFAHEGKLLGGLSKWLHFHLGLWEETASQWTETNSGRFANFLSEQDQRYGTSFAALFNQPSLAEPGWDHLNKDALKAVIRPDASWRQALHDIASLPAAEERDGVRELASRLLNSLVPPTSATETAEIARAIVRGGHWGKLIVTARKILLAHARHQDLQLVKIDAPSGHWKPDLFSEEQVVEAMRWLAEHPGLFDEFYQEYRLSCLNVLHVGLKP